MNIGRHWPYLKRHSPYKNYNSSGIFCSALPPPKEQSSRLRRGTSQLDSSCATRERQLFIYLLIYLDTSLPLKIINILSLKEKKEKEE